VGLIAASKSRITANAQENRSSVLSLCVLNHS
jgi:hypothetical protein